MSNSLFKGRVKFGGRTALHCLIYVVLIVASFLVIVVADRFAGLSIELSFGWCLLAIAVLLNRIESFKAAPGRFIFIFLTAAISLRYLLWRTSETLIYSDPLDLAGMVLIYAAECYAIIILFLGMFISIWPLERAPEPLPDDPTVYPTVDVLVPTFTEPEEIIRLTLTAATQIDYPRGKIAVYLLDDGSTLARRNNPATSAAAAERHARLQHICRELGVRYLTRETNDHAKAGNINDALRGLTGDLILALDCDHVPTRDILRNTVGWFLKDAKLFLVQTPHFFINTTTVEKNIGSFSNAPGENDMFHYSIQLGMDLWNASYFCGSAAVLRRAFLMETGGMLEKTVTEDADTSLHLHARGYRSAYINRPMICGLSPESFNDYIIQRTRWAQGMAQILVLSNPLFVRGLTLQQRLCYFNSCFFWFFGIARFIFYIGPGFFLILGLKVYHASVLQILAYALPHVLNVYVVMDFQFGKYRRRFFSEIYESVQSLFLMPAVIAALINPRRLSFKATPKGRRIDREFLNPLATTFFIICLVNFIGIGFAAFKWFQYPLYRPVIFVALCWCTYNSILGLVTLGAFWERQQQRQYHRTKSKGAATVFFPRLGRGVSGEIKDLSLTGIGVDLHQPLPAVPGEQIRVVSTDSYGMTHDFLASVKTQRERDGRTSLGIEFVLNDETYPGIVRFVYGDSQRWADISEERFQRVRSLRVTYRDLYFFLQRGLKGSAERIAHIGGLAMQSGVRILAGTQAWLAGKAADFRAKGAYRIL